MKSKTRADKNSGPALNCTYTELRDTATLKPNPRNPNKHGAEQLRLYAKILKHQGWRKAIVVSRQNGFIVAGHGAWQAAAQEGWPQVPVDLQDFKSPADEYAHLGCRQQAAANGRARGGRALTRGHG